MQIAARLKVSTDAVKKVIVWGNHSSTQFPDASHATVDKDGQTLGVYDAVQDDAWLQGEFLKVSQRRRRRRRRRGGGRERRMGVGTCSSSSLA